MRNFRFLHAADIHLDSPLQRLTLQDDSAAGRVRRATRDALDRLVGVALEESVDFLVIAGDLYDGDWRDYNTGQFFVRQMGRLREAGIPVYLLHGNHDAENRITRHLDLPDNVRVFGSRKPETFRVEGLPVMLHGRSFPQRDVEENLVPDYPPPVAGVFNIGVLHTGLGGRAGHANYAPCSLEDLVNKGYDYWALGHVHKAEILHERPYIVFPGNLQGRHARETGAKGARLVAVDDGEIVDCAFMPCDIVRWAALRLPVNEAQTMTDILGRIRHALVSAIADEADGRLLICRIMLEGRTALHNRLLASEEQLLEEARAVAFGLGDEVARVEKLLVETSAPLSDAPPPGPPGGLQDMLRDAGEDAELLGRMEDDIGKLVARLPYEIRMAKEDGGLQSAIEGNYAGLVEQATPWLIARLTAGEQ